MLDGERLATMAEEKHRSKPSAAAPSNGGQPRATAYAQAAMDREVGRVTAAREGERNHTLNSAAYSLGQLVGGGQLPEAEVSTALRRAANACGLPDREAQRTIASGLGSGKKEPRSAPFRRRLLAMFLCVRPLSLSRLCGTGRNRSDPAEARSPGL